MLTPEAAGISANVQEKWTNNFGEMPWNQDDPSSDVAFCFVFRVGHQYGIRAVLLRGKRFNCIHRRHPVDILV